MRVRAALWDQVRVASSKRVSYLGKFVGGLVRGHLGGVEYGVEERRVLVLHAVPHVQPVLRGSHSSTFRLDGSTL
jgi:hypothetical protein